MLRSDIKKFLNNKMIIYRPTKTDDGYGGVSMTYDKVDWELPCRVYRYKGNYTIAYEGTDYRITNKLLCYAYTNIQEGDKIYDELLGRYYLVLSKDQVQSVKRVNHIECMISEMNAKEQEEVQVDAP